MTLSVESALHSFVLDQTEVVATLLNEKDWESFEKEINRTDLPEETEVLSEWKLQEIARYSKGPNGVEDVIFCGLNHIKENALDKRVDYADVKGFSKRLYGAMFRLSTLYEINNNNLELVESRLESWYSTRVWGILIDLIYEGSTWLTFRPGEVCSSASSLRRNKGRDLETRKASGRKIDGILRCTKADVEICAIEVGPKDEGETGTKVLKDGRKVGKLLKDMFDHICTKSLRDIRSELRVYGLLVSGLRVEFISFKYLPGRFNRLTRENTLYLPSSWDEESVRAILLLVKEMLLFRNRMEAMAKLAYNATLPDKESYLLSSSRHVTPPPSHVRTLSTPRNSPKQPRANI
ncbi:hypothetical protein BGX26_008801 [Mortierella sp. AD094]|nr:hypothetical protein BGX26_008801 [Mortierella sp. AD094]